VRGLLSLPPGDEGSGAPPKGPASASPVSAAPTATATAAAAAAGAVATASAATVTPGSPTGCTLGVAGGPCGPVQPWGACRAYTPQPRRTRGGWAHGRFGRGASAAEDHFLCREEWRASCTTSWGRAGAHAGAGHGQQGCQGQGQGQGLGQGARTHPGPGRQGGAHGHAGHGRQAGTPFAGWLGARPHEGRCPWTAQESQGNREPAPRSPAVTPGETQRRPQLWRRQRHWHRQWQW